jgi:hypothetical protein
VAEADDGKEFYMFNLIHYFPELRKFPGAPDFKGTPQECNVHYMKSLKRLWLTHAAYARLNGSRSLRASSASSRKERGAR